ncbi:MAG: C-GCAxxG-C-C family protein [Desulfomonilaceae bacterium]
MMDKVSQRAGEVFESGYYCAESVLLAVAEGRGIKSEVIPRIATGFCGGMSRTCGTCGAVSGGVMAIGLCLGRTTPNESVAPAYGAVGKFSEKFKARFGSINCKDLTGCDLGTEEGQNYFKANNLKEQCKGYTEEAARIAMLLIEEELGNPGT